MNFIKKVAENKIDELTHMAFTRYSPGTFEKTSLKVRNQSTGIKISAGFEYLNAIENFVLSLCDGKVKVHGEIITPREELRDRLTEAKIDFTEEPKRGMRGAKLYKFVIKGEYPAKDIKKLFEQINDCFLMFDLSCGKRATKVKKKTPPKIGKDSPTYITATLPKEDLDIVVKEWLFDVKPEKFKLAELKHTYDINDVIVDEKLLAKDPSEARKKAKRKGTIHREAIIDGNSKKSDIKLLA